MRLFSVLLFLPFIVTIQAQDARIDELMKLRPMGVGKVKVDTGVGIFLPMPFAEARFIDLSQLKKIDNINSIYGIDLVYTRYREVDSFNQPKLNLYRFKELRKIYPQVFSQNDIVWRVVEQRDAVTKENAEKCFHGFVIYLKNDVPDSFIRKEIKTISEILDSYHDTLVWIPEKIEWRVKKIKIETGNYLPRDQKKRKEGITYKSRSIWFREPEYVIHRDSIVRKKTGGYFQKIGKFDTTKLPGTSEFKTLAKRKWSSKQAVVVDVTGSMSPFTTQVMLWVKYDPDVLKRGRFTFFNDGDNTPDIYKKIGNTGGIYIAGTHNYDTVFNVMTRAMRHGLGGDMPENDLEAVRETIKNWPDTDTILLIADNEAPVKDISLLSSLKKPISVMACGVVNKIHPDYIKIVMNTGGRLFVLEHELQNLKSLKTGSRITIGPSVFEYQRGALIKVK